MSLRPLPILGLLLFAVPLAAAPSLTPMVSLTVDSEKVEYSDQTQVLETAGATEIRAEVVGDPQRRVLIKTPAARADLQAHTVEASEGVEFVLPGGWLRGEALSLQMEPPAFSLDEAHVVLNLAPTDAPPVLGQLRGRSLAGHDDVLVLRDGLVSPCTDEDPHVAFRFRRLDVNLRNYHWRLRGTSLDFYGVRIPLLPVVYFRAGGDSDSRGLLPTPGYSKRDGLYLPYYLNFARGAPDRISDLRVRVTAKRGLTFLSQHRLQSGDWIAEGWASRMESVRTKLEGGLVYDRLPELLLTGYQQGPEQDQGWKVGASLGNFYERDEAPDGPPEVHRLRAQAGLGYEWGGTARAQREGRWASVWSTGAVYSQGEHYTDTVLTLGAGRRFGSSLQADLQYLHHFEGGRTPFQFDRVDLRRELRPRVDWQISPAWRVLSQGRYDTADGRLRDYRLELSKREHCLTWTAFYNFVGASLGLRVDLNGLTGGTPALPLSGHLAEEYLRSQRELNRPSPP